jgi:hypothetical protein
MKKLTLIFLLAMANVANAAPAVGEWTAKFWVDSTGKYYGTWNICIQNSGDWYITSGFSGFKGKWFSKGNETHLQVIHSGGMNAISFDLYRTNNNLLTGYNMGIDYKTGADGYYTTTLTYKGATCPAYIP